jgi:hypothetical protein
MRLMQMLQSLASTFRLWHPMAGSGARFGPRGIREASTLFSFGHGGAYDHEDDVTYLPNQDKVRIVDLGDADIVHTDTESVAMPTLSMACGQILKAGVVASGVLGGDHSVNIPCINAFDEDCATQRCRSMSSRSTPTWISSTCATECATATAARCGGQPRSPTCRA